MLLVSRTYVLLGGRPWPVPRAIPGPITGRLMLQLSLQRHHQLPLLLMRRLARGFGQSRLQHGGALVRARALLVLVLLVLVLPAQVGQP
jgi:hypothetical protein